MYQAPILSGPSRKLTQRRAALGPRYIYLGEDDQCYYYMDGFFDDIGNMFKRMVKITPKSFTPGNIYEGFVNLSLTTMTGGLYQVLPKNIKKTVYDVGKVAIPIVGGAALAMANPGLMSSLTSKLSQAGSILGKHAGTIGGLLFGFLNKMPPAQQTQVAEQLTPEQIAQIEQGYVPPEVQALMKQAAQAAYYPPQPPMTTMEAYGQAPAPAPVQAGMDSNMMLFIGLSAVGLLITMRR